MGILRLWRFTSSWNAMKILEIVPVSSIPSWPLVCVAASAAIESIPDLFRIAEVLSLQFLESYYVLHMVGHTRLLVGILHLRGFASSWNAMKILVRIPWFALEAE